jgi:hypothetical protein
LPRLPIPDSKFHLSEKNHSEFHELLDNKQITNNNAGRENINYDDD